MTSAAVAPGILSRTGAAWRRHILWAASLSLAFASSGAAQPAARQVLLLKSFEHQPFSVNTEIFRTELSRLSPEPINFFEMSIQPSALAPSPNEQPVVDYIASTLAGRPLDLVVSVGGPAAVFTQKYGGQLFPATPLLHIAVDGRFLQGKSFSAYETAIDGQMDFPRMIENMLLLLPDTNTVFVVIGASQFEDFWRKELSLEFERFKNRLTFVWLNNFSFTEMLERASALPQRSAILLAPVAVDSEGILLSQERVLNQLHAVANRPIFGLLGIQLGHGIVGGPVLSSANMGRQNADVALRLLRGESPRTIKTASEPDTQSTYDWRELRRWDISEARLPAGSIVQFRQPGVWDQYKGYIVATAMLLGLQSALIGGLMFQRVRRRRTELALRESEQRFRGIAEENQDLAGRLITAQEDERRRVARELHDDFNQRLALLSVQMELLGQSESDVDAGERSGRMAAQLRELSSDVHKLSHQLHPVKVEHLGLVMAAGSWCEDLVKQSGLHIEFSAESVPADLAPATSLCLYRIIQESLRNVVRHSQAKAARVELSGDNGNLRLTITDNGQGFDMTEASHAGGLGLVSMQERMRLLQGAIAVSSSPGRGTRIEATVPLRPVPVPAG